MFDEKEMAAWESEQSFSRDHVKIHKNPKRAKLRDFRKGIKGVHYNKEVKEIRKSDYRKYRIQMKCLLRGEHYELLRGYQRTGGRLTW